VKVSRPRRNGQAKRRCGEGGPADRRQVWSSREESYSNSRAARRERTRRLNRSRCQTAIESGTAPASSRKSGRTPGDPRRVEARDRPRRPRSPSRRETMCASPPAPTVLPTAPQAPRSGAPRHQAVVSEIEGGDFAYPPPGRRTLRIPAPRWARAREVHHGTAQGRGRQDHLPTPAVGESEARCAGSRAARTICPWTTAPIPPPPKSRAPTRRDGRSKAGARGCCRPGVCGATDP